MEVSYIPLTDANLTISSNEASATFKGRVIIFETTQNGGFKFIPIEGEGQNFHCESGSIEVNSGRMILIIVEPSYFGDAYDIDLMLMIKPVVCLIYFDPLPSFGRISLAILCSGIKIKRKV